MFAKLETQSCPCLESCLINQTQPILDPGHSSEVIHPVPFWPSMACRWRYLSIQVRIKDPTVRLGSFLGHFCTRAILTGGSRETGIPIRPPKVGLNEQGKPLKSYHTQLLSPQGGISAPFLAAASKPHTWCLSGDTRMVNNPSSELAKRSGRGWTWPFSRIQRGHFWVALPLSPCDATESRGRRLVSSCLKSSGALDGMGWQVSTRCKTGAINLA